MATMKRGRSRPATTRSTATNLSDAKVLVSGHRGLRYPSLRTGETIVFDKEIAPGIFTPSAPVSDDLAEEYRSVSGTLGVIVYGSLRREMTLAEIKGLQPDDPGTVEQDMRSITTQNPGRVFYDVVRVQRDPIVPHTLNRGVRGDLARAFGRTPSDTFIGDVEKSLGGYLWDREQVSNATPKKVRDRVAKVRKAIEALCAAVDELQDSDSSLISLAVTREFLKNRPTVSENKIRGLLTLYHRHITEAEARFDQRTSGKKEGGRMFAYAEVALARRIADLVQRETGVRPTTTRARKKEGVTARGSIFTLVLTILLDFVPTGSRKPRKDVEALARRALKSLPSGNG